MERGLRANREDLSILLADVDPTAVSLQETFSTADKTIKFNNYTTYYMPAVEANGTLRGGVALLIQNGTPHSQISLNTSLQAIALRITLHSALRLQAKWYSNSLNCIMLVETSHLTQVVYYISRPFILYHTV